MLPVVYAESERSHCSGTKSEEKRTASSSKSMTTADKFSLIKKVQIKTSEQTNKKQERKKTTIAKVL